MKKLHIVIAIVVIVALAVAGAYLFASSSNNVKLNSSTFKLPNHFTVKGNASSNNLSVVHISSGDITLSVAEVKDNNNLDQVINRFKKDVESKGTVDVKDFDVGDSKIDAKKVVYKRTNNETNNTTEIVAIRYYASKDNKVYFVESKDKDHDKLAKQIILSLKKKII